VSVIPPESPAETGYLHSSGSPAAKIRIWGVFEQAAQEFEAIIDTGFSGFLSMPMVQAFPLGLVLMGTTNVVLADGSTDTKLIALGRVRLGASGERQGVVILEPNNTTDILIGMEFLAQFELTLVLIGERAFPDDFQVKQPVLLVRNAVVQELLGHVKSAAEKASAPLPAPSGPAAADPPASN
jgi:predicted aspartyl protease